jgi:hypothetical protein
MSLTSGAKQGSYEILDAIGAGGMGEVRLTGKNWFGGVTVSDSIGAILHTEPD